MFLQKKTWMYKLCFWVFLILGLICYSVAIPDKGEDLFWVITALGCFILASLEEIKINASKK